MWTRLLGNRESVKTGLKTSGSQPKLQGEWASFLRKVVKAKTSAGTPKPISRLSHTAEYLSGFSADDDVSIKIIAPVEFEIGGKPANG